MGEVVQQEDWDVHAEYLLVVGNRFTSCSLVYGLNCVILVALGGLLIAPTRTALSVVAAAPAYRPLLSMY